MRRKLADRGICGKPHCGVEMTSSGYTGGPPTGPGPASARVAGRGVFIEELLAELERRGVAFAAEEVGKKEGTGGDS